MPTHILRIASLVTVSCAALCACSANIEEAPSSAWAHELQTAREEVDGESSEAFVLQVLADDVVSDAEIEEAGIRMESCMHDRGYDTFSYRPRDQNFGELGSPERWDAEAVESDRISCAKQTGSSVVSYLWSSMRSNPQNIDPNELFISCLKKLKVVDDAYSATTYQQEFEKYLAEHRNSDGFVDSDPLMAVIPFVTDKSSAQQAVRSCIHEPQTILYPDLQEH